MSSRATDVTIVEVTGKSDLRRFMDFATDVYKDYPLAVAPMRVDLETILDPERSPFLNDNAHQAFLAVRDGRVVGRIMAIESVDHLAIHKDQTGHFGFLEFLPGGDALPLLLDAAAGWLRARGLSRMVGPMSPSINHEVGILIEGYDCSPTYLMNYAPEHYDADMLAAGMSKAMDIFSFTASTAAADQPVRLTKMLDKARKGGRLTLRRLDMKHYRRDIDLMVDVYNDGWADNWGAIPLSRAEAHSLGTLLRPLILPEWLTFVEVDGQAMAVVLQMPDLNQATKDLNGRLLPFGWLRLLTRMRTPTVTHSRVLMLGVRRSFQGLSFGPLAALLLLEDSLRVGRQRGIATSEVGWILETNKAILSAVNQFNVGGRKTYRIYERPL